MLGPGLLLISLLLRLCVACYSPANSSNHSRRWYSVKPLPATGTPSGPAAWPVDSCGHQWVRYCFESERDRDTLLDIFVHAIAMWAPAAKYSGLGIQPDDSCGGQYECVCGDDTAPDSLVASIVDGSTMHATVGYNYLDGSDSGSDSGSGSDDDDSDSVVGSVSTRNPTPQGSDDGSGDGSGDGSSEGSDDKGAGRHFLHYGTDHVPAAGDVHGRRIAYLAMARGLGHVLGFTHEHQGPDRDSYIVFNCEALQGYAQAKGKLMQPPASADTRFKGGDANARMAEVCGDSALAVQYFPGAVDYVKLPEDPHLAYPSGGPYDCGSIMGYDSSFGGIAQPDNPSNYDYTTFPMLRKPAMYQQYLEQSLIHQAGSDEIGKCSISALDIKRAATLYPGTAAQQALAQNLGQWSMETAVRIEGPTDVLVKDWHLQPGPVEVALRPY